MAHFSAFFKIYNKLHFFKSCFFLKNIRKKRNRPFGKKSGDWPLLFPNKRKLIFSKTANEHLSVVRVAIGEDVMVVAAEITSLGSFRSGDQERGSWNSPREILICEILKFLDCQSQMRNSVICSNSICSNSAKSTFLTAKKHTVDLEEADAFNLKKRVELIFRYWNTS